MPVKSRGRGLTDFRKFVAMQIRDLVLEGDTPVYTSSFDRVIEDIFGYRKLGSKIEACRNERELNLILASFEREADPSVFRDSRMYDALADMVRMNYDIRRLDKKITRAKRNNRSIGKYDQKERDKLVKLYRKTLKAICKLLNIRERGSRFHSDRYRAAKRLVDRGGYDDFYGSSGFGILLDDDDDDFDFDSQYAYDYYEEYRNRNQRRRAPERRYESRLYRDTDDPLGIDSYDGDDDDDLSEAELGMAYAELPKRAPTLQDYLGKRATKPAAPSSTDAQIASLTQSVNSLTHAVEQALGGMRMMQQLRTPPSQITYPTPPNHNVYGQARSQKTIPKNVRQRVAATPLSTLLSQAGVQQTTSPVDPEDADFDAAFDAQNFGDATALPPGYAIAEALRQQAEKEQSDEPARLTVEAAVDASDDDKDSLSREEIINLINQNPAATMPEAESTDNQTQE